MTSPPTDGPENETASGEVSLKKTPLDGLHRRIGAKMVPFAGYDMPVQYAPGILKEHTQTRTAAGLFDVSHMGQVRIFGPGRAAALERLVPVDIVDLPEGRQRYALFTADNGGILDDLMVANAGDYLALVVNAACKDADLAHLQKHLGDDVSIEPVTDRALLALQGPASAEILAEFAPDVKTMRFMDVRNVSLDGISADVTRSGYTGEDGFEISLPADDAEGFAERLLAHAAVLPVGLGARDSLRLEAGLCLYGHDIDTATSPVEAGLTWSLSKVRRPGGDRAGGYPGADAIAGHLQTGVTRKRVGLQPEGRAPVREGVEIFAEGTEAPIGKVTSGGFGPSVQAPVAMGYVAQEFAKPDTPLVARMRGREFPMKVAKLPFIKPGYVRD